jgi:hypothetical protein
MAPVHFAKTPFVNFRPNSNASPNHLCISTTDAALHSRPPRRVAADLSTLTTLLAAGTRAGSVRSSAAGACREVATVARAAAEALAADHEEECRLHELEDAEADASERACRAAPSRTPSAAGSTPIHHLSPPGSGECHQIFHLWPARHPASTRLPRRTLAAHSGRRRGCTVASLVPPP